MGTCGALRRLSRRAALRLGGGLAASALLPAPAVIASDRLRPIAPSGLQIGDVEPGRAVLWTRSDRPARLIVEYGLQADFGDAVRAEGPLALPENDGTVRVQLSELAEDRDIHVRLTLADLHDGRLASAPITARFRSASKQRRDVRFLWSADICGQGFGINPEWGGLRLFETMRRAEADFLVLCGDIIYADDPLPPALDLADGLTWRNEVVPEKAKVAETLGDYRGNYAYNLRDAHVRALASETPQLWLWDDHEVMNNWSPEKSPSGGRAAVARRAFFDYAPMLPRHDGRLYRRISYGPLLDVFITDMRSHRGANSHNRQHQPGPATSFLGDRQLAWLKRGLAGSTALWKAVATSLPIGLLSADHWDADSRRTFDGPSNGPGPPLGREFEIADLLSFLRQARVRNVVWFTGDAHHAAARFYDPRAAVFQDFDPFWEFMAGPIHGATFTPAGLDPTFGPIEVFRRAPLPDRDRLPPTAGQQFFGDVLIAGPTGAMSVALRDLAGAVLFSETLAPL